MAPTKNSSPTSSDASRLLTRGFRFLRFDEPLETEFRTEHRARLRVWCRIAIIVSACTVVGFAILDHFVLSPEHSRITNVVRFGLHVPCVLIMLLLTSKRFYTRWYELGISFIAPMFGIGTVIMSAFSPPNEVPLVGGRLLLACFFFYFMLGLPLRAAARANGSVNRPTSRARATTTGVPASISASSQVSRSSNATVEPRRASFRWRSTRSRARPKSAPSSIALNVLEVICGRLPPARIQSPIHCSLLPPP